MPTVVRLARVGLILALAFMTISFVIAIGTASTGLVEKTVLLGLIGGCVYAAAKVTTVSDRLVHHFNRR